MQRRDALKAMGALAATSALGGVARGAQAPGDEIPLPELVKKLGPMMNSVPIEVSSLGNGRSLISGPGGNITALVGPDGIVMVDSFVPSRGAELAPMVRKLGPGPIMLINTHWHFDHTGGNAALAGIGARIVAHESVRKRLESEQYMADFQLKIPPSPAAALPVVGFGGSVTFFLNGEEIHLAHVAPAHTDGDIFIHFRKANVLQTGDLFSNGFYPNIDSSSGGWVGGMIAAADRILGVADARTRIIPGHGPMGQGLLQGLPLHPDRLQRPRQAPREVAGPLLKEVVTVEEARRHAMSLPMSVTIGGADPLALLRQDLAIARGLRPMPLDEIASLRARCAPKPASATRNPASGP